MPIFMDRHDIPGLTAMDVAEGHKQDLKIQDEYQCRALTYWFDEERETAFCLIEAPNKKAVENLHNNAHGLMPNQIIQVDTKLVEAFLGKIKDPEIPSNADNRVSLIVNDSAFRSILAIQFREIIPIKSKIGISPALKLFRKYGEALEETLEKYNGRAITYSSDGLIASFDSAFNSFECAFELQRNNRKANPADQMPIAIGLSAGDPVTNKDDIFGDAIKLAKQLCSIARKDKIIVSSVVRNRCRNKGVNIESANGIIKILRPEEENFLRRLLDVTERVWNQEDLDVAVFAKILGLSKSQLYRKITSLTECSPTEFIKETRLRRATRLIEKQQGNISQIAFKVGFSNPSYFSKCFKQRFGILPSNYRNAVI